MLGFERGEICGTVIAALLRFKICGALRGCFGVPASQDQRLKTSSASLHFTELARPLKQERTYVIRAMGVGKFLRLIMGNLR
jgi:hypothetical protein